jgi:hypothetical protein
MLPLSESAQIDRKQGSQSNTECTEKDFMRFAQARKLLRCALRPSYRLREATKF